MEETTLEPYFHGEDNISRLPDELILYIMSFIDTKFAVQTCVLSKRWIDIWKTLPILNFDRNSFPEEKKDSFIKFVDMVFNFHKDYDIQKFKVRWRNAYDTLATMNINRWIIEVVKYNVKEIDILIARCHVSPYEIPDHLLNCKSLRKLVMQVTGNARRANIILPGSMNLPQLKELHLIGLSISNVDSSKSLFSSCPVLEMLWMSDCDIQTDNQRNFIVDSPSLKEFIYIRRRYRLLQHHTTIKLCAPNLEIFTFKSFFTNDYSLENFSPTLKVSIYMKLMAKEEDENAEIYSDLLSKGKDVYAIRMMKFVGAVRMVKEMRLSPGFLEVFSQAANLLDSEPPCLSNLQHLTLKMWFTRGCLRAIAYLLKISPNIIAVYLKNKESNLSDVGDGWEAGLSSPGMLSRLEFVQIKEVEGCDNELQFLSFLFKNAIVLKKVVLYLRSTIDSPDRVREEFQDKLRALPRASARILVLLHGSSTKSTRFILKTNNKHTPTIKTQDFSCEIK